METLLDIITLMEKVEYNNEYGLDIEKNEEIAAEVEEIISERMYFDIFISTYNYLSQASISTDQSTFFLHVIQSQFNAIHDLILEFSPQIALSTFYDLEYFRCRLARRGYALAKYETKSVTNETVKSQSRNLIKAKLQIEELRTFSYSGENSFNAYDFMLKMLIKENKIGDTTKVTFRKAFSNIKIRDIRKKINWTGTVPELKLLIKVMVDCNKIAKVANSSQVVSSLFTIRSKDISADQLNSNSGTASKTYEAFLNELMTRC